MENVIINSNGYISLLFPYKQATLVKAFGGSLCGVSKSPLKAPRGRPCLSPGISGGQKTGPHRCPREELQNQWMHGLTWRRGLCWCDLRDLEMGRWVIPMSSHGSPEMRGDRRVWARGTQHEKAALAGFADGEQARRQGMQKASRSWERPGNRFLPGASRRNTAQLHWILVQWDPSQTSDLQNCHIINLCSFKSPSLWWFATAARRHRVPTPDHAHPLGASVFSFVGTRTLYDEFSLAL